MRLLPFALLAVAAVASSGCRRSMAPLCRQICTCSPCTQDDFDACVTKGEKAQQGAEKTGCADPFDTLVNCLEDNWSCGKSGDTAGGTSAPGTGQCTRADRAMVICDGTVNPFASVCDEAPIKTQACTGVVPTTKAQPTLGCSGVNACLASCTLAQPCDVLAGTAPMDALTACNTACPQVMGGGPPPPGGDPK